MPEMRLYKGLLGAGAILRSNRKEDLMAKEKPNGEIVIQPNDAALIYEEGGGLSLVLPDHREDDDAHPMVMLLAVVLARANDPKWLQEMISMYDGIDIGDT